MSITDEPKWKEVAETFWYACYHGDGELLEYMVEKYNHWFIEEEEE